MTDKTKEDLFISRQLEAAANSIRQQVMDNPGLPVPVDPDVADYMGAFEEEAVDFEDADNLENLIEVILREAK